METDRMEDRTDPRPYNPLARTRFAFRTLKCRLHRADVEADRAAIDLLFERYSKAVDAFRRLIPVRAPDRSAFRKEDYVGVKALAPGLVSSIRTAARDRAIEMWRSRDARERRGLRTGVPGSASSSARLRDGDYRGAIRLDKDTYGLQVHPGPGLLFDPARDRDIILSATIPVPACGGNGQGRDADRSRCAGQGDGIGSIVLRIMGRDHQIPALASVLRGDRGILRRSAELIWRGRGNDRDLYLDIRLMRPVDPCVRDIVPILEDALTRSGNGRDRSHPLQRHRRIVPVGVDTGLVNTVVAVAPGKGRRGVLFVGGRRDRAVRKRFAERRAALSRMAEGGGRSAARKAGRMLEDLYRAEGRFVRDMCHKASRAVVDHALSPHVADRVRGVGGGELPVIVLERLSFRDINRAVDPQTNEDAPMRGEQADELRSWAYGLLRDLIIEKCAWEGVPVVIIPANGTGLECPRCGAGAFRRRDVHRLVCPECTYRANDDYAAALNLAERLTGGVGGAEALQHHDNDLREASGLREEGDVGTS